MQIQGIFFFAADQLAIRATGKPTTNAWPITLFRKTAQRNGAGAGPPAFDNGITTHCITKLTITP